MTEEEKQHLRIMFEYIITMLKSEAEFTARISAELASVVAAVRGLDPTFDEVLKHRREEVDEITDPAIRTNLDLYDEQIRKVRNGEIL